MNNLNNRRKALSNYSARHKRRLIAKNQLTVLSDSDSSENSNTFSLSNNVFLNSNNLENNSKDLKLINKSENDCSEQQIQIHNSNALFTSTESLNTTCLSEESLNTKSLSNESLNNISDYSNQSTKSDLEVTQINNFQTDLCEWSIKNNISHMALSELLVLLKKHTHSELPVTARTLLKTKRSANHDIINVGNGFYWHYGVQNCIKQIASEIITYNKNITIGTLPRIKTIELLINIDGLPLTKSSNNCLWPILCSDTKIKKVFLIGAYQGNEKISDSNLFLSKFVNEINPLITNNFFYNNWKFKIILKPLNCYIGNVINKIYINSI